MDVRGHGWVTLARSEPFHKTLKLGVLFRLLPDRSVVDADGQTLAVSWGQTLQNMVWEVTADQSYDVEIVQMVGGLSHLDTGHIASAGGHTPRE